MITITEIFRKIRKKYPLLIFLIMNRESKIARIYEVIADKTLSFGCQIIHKWVVCKILSEYKDKERLFVWNTMDGKYVSSNLYTNRVRKDSIQKIIWHTVLIGDVLDWIGRQSKPRWWYHNRASEILSLREDNWLRNPIDVQTSECIDFIYSLVKDENI